MPGSDTSIVPVHHKGGTPCHTCIHSQHTIVHMEGCPKTMAATGAPTEQSTPLPSESGGVFALGFKRSPQQAKEQPGPISKGEAQARHKREREVCNFLCACLFACCLPGLEEEEDREQSKKAEKEGSFLILHRREPKTGQIMLTERSTRTRNGTEGQLKAKDIGGWSGGVGGGLGII